MAKGMVIKFINVGKMRESEPKWQNRQDDRQKRNMAELCLSRSFAGEFTLFAHTSLLENCELIRRAFSLDDDV